MRNLILLVSLILVQSLSYAWGVDTVPPNPITDLTLTNPTIRSVLLTWTSTGDDGKEGTASSYDIRYSIQEITESNWNQAIPCQGSPQPIIPRPQGQWEHFVVTNLNPDTLYYFAIKVKDEAGNASEPSNVAVKRTSKNEPPPALFPSSLISKTTWRWRCSRQGNEEEEYKWWTAHYDMAIDGQPFGFWKKINPEVRIIRYQIDLTMLRGGGDTPPEKENPELQQYCQDTGYEYEDCFLHFYEDTLVNIKGKEYLIPGYGSGTAKTKKESRIPAFVWADWRWSYYPGYSCVQNYFAREFYDLVH
ncbi:MAG: fibronectin type III domain-containing protein, partial [bacterium]